VADVAKLSVGREDYYIRELATDHEQFLVPLAGLEPATCCLGDNCQSSGLYGSVGSSQVWLGGDSVQCGLVRSSKDWWNDRENDQLSKRDAWGCAAAVPSPTSSS
jgi:hypothetical protein